MRVRKAGTKKEPPLSRGLSRFIEAFSLGLIQQQDRHLASLRRNHSGGKLVIELLLLFLWGLFLHSTLQFGFGFDGPLWGLLPNTWHRHLLSFCCCWRSTRAYWIAFATYDYRATI